MPTACDTACQTATPPSRHAGQRLACALALALGLQAGAALAQGVLVGRVVRVHDGDSLTLQQGRHGVAVRLAAVDAPELEQPHGESARDALQACAFGRQVVVQVHGPDRHGRTVGQLEAVGRDCGLRLIELGLAWHYKAYEREQPLAERAAYAAAERNARRRRIGLWADESPEPPWAWRRTHPPSNGWMR
jgi:endonuclease YncB( thermonuclease family)